MAPRKLRASSSLPAFNTSNVRDSFRRAARASRGAAHRDAAPVDPFSLERIPRKYRVKVGSVVYDARVLVDYWRHTSPRAPRNAYRTEVSPANVERVRRVAASADSSPEVSPVNWSNPGLPSSSSVPSTSRFGLSVPFPAPLYSGYPDWDRLSRDESLPVIRPRRYVESEASDLSRAAMGRLRQQTYRPNRE